MESTDEHMSTALSSEDQQVLDKLAEARALYEKYLEIKTSREQGLFEKLRENDGSRTETEFFPQPTRLVFKSSEW